MRRLSLLKIFVLLVLSCFFLSSSAIADSWKDESGKGKKAHHKHKKEKKKKKKWEHEKEDEDEKDDKNYHHHYYQDRVVHYYYYDDENFHRGGHSIPSDHYPPPGKCRIWFPDRPVGQQPPPGDCTKLRNRAPVGTLLLENTGIKEVKPADTAKNKSSLLDIITQQYKIIITAPEIKPPDFLSEQPRDHERWDNPDDTWDNPDKRPQPEDHAEPRESGWPQGRQTPDVLPRRPAESSSL